MEPNPHDASETPRICYNMAYFVLPRFLFSEPDRVLEAFQAGPRVGAHIYYVITCESHEKVPREDVMSSLSVHAGILSATDRYYVVEYPPPPPVDLAGLPEEEIMRVLGSVVLAPYFSAIVQDQATRELRYFVLGQSTDGHTTLRRVTPELNANMGRGCEPELDSFVALLAERA